MGNVSIYLIAVASAWIISQGIKYLINSRRNRSFNGNLRQLYLSGGMPSAHSATVAALLMVVGVKDGVDTALFALAALFSAIIMYDAFMVRRSSGEQGQAIKAMIIENKSKVAVPRIAKGHTPLEVLIGAAIGATIGIIVIFIST